MPVDVPPIVQYLRQCCDTLPRLNARGELFWKRNKLKGRGAVKDSLDPKNRLGIRETNKLRRDDCPSFPFVSVPNPNVLAKKLLNANFGDDLTPEVVEQAAGYFCIPSGQRFLLMAPETFCREELQQHEKFQVYNETGNVTGLMPCCSHCKSNIGVSYHAWECHNVKFMPRSMINTDATRLPLVGVRHSCSNKECPGPVPKGDKLDDGQIHVHDTDGKPKFRNKGKKKDDPESPVLWDRNVELQKEHTFVMWNKECFGQFPANVRKIFSRFVFGLAEEGEPLNLPSPQMAGIVLNTDNTFGSLEKSLETSFQLIQANAVAAYQDFVEEHGQKYAVKQDIASLLTDKRQQQVVRKVHWSKFDKAAFRKELGPPKEDGIKTTFWVAYGMMRPYLERDIHSRSPGRILRWDGTYKA